MRFLLAGMVCAALLVGCSNDSPSGAGLPVDPGFDAAGVGTSLLPEPADLTTGHDATSTRIAVSYQSQTFPGDYSQALSLRTHPGDVVVGTSFEAEQFDAGPPPGGAWVLHPTEPLAPGWYALVLAKGAGYFAYLSHHRDDGAWESRFRVGSYPLLTGVGACASNEPNSLPKLRLDFSEAVALPAGTLPIGVVAAGAPVSCVIYDPPSEAHPGMGLTCTPPIPASAPVTVTVGTGVVSASSGQPLRTSTGPLPHSFDLPDGENEPGCRYWRETQVPVE